MSYTWINLGSSWLVSTWTMCLQILCYNNNEFLKNLLEFVNVHRKVRWKTRSNALYIYLVLKFVNQMLVHLSFQNVNPNICIPVTSEPLPECTMCQYVIIQQTKQQDKTHLFISWNYTVISVKWEDAPKVSIYLSAAPNPYLLKGNMTVMKIHDDLIAQIILILWNRSERFPHCKEFF